MTQRVLWWLRVTQGVVTSPAPLLECGVSALGPFVFVLCGAPFADVLFLLPLAPGSACVAGYSPLWLLRCLRWYFRAAQGDSG